MENLKELQEFEECGLISAERMRAVDRNAISLGLSSLQMMETAGRALAERILERNPARVLVLCGKGNNGGDGMAAARHLQRSADVQVLYRASAAAGDTVQAQLRLLARSGVTLIPVQCRDEVLAQKQLFSAADLILDALLGIGVQGPPREPVQTCVELANGSGKPIVAADVPTPGMRASRIIAFHRPKLEGSEVVDIGIPLEAECVVGPGDVSLVRPRPAHTHKGLGGKVVVIGGGPYQGAPILTGLAAMRSGADIVRIVSTGQHPFLDLIHVPLPGDRIQEEHIEPIQQWVEWADSVAIGPGLGEKSHAVVQQIAPCCKKTVYDADALRLPLPTSQVAVYTPHAGEFARITGIMPPEDLVSRARTVLKSALPGVVLLKGAVDIITDGIRVRFNRTGTPAMAVAGTGDVLAGITAALLCRLPPFEAACVAAYVNGRAGMTASASRGDGMLASDLLERIPAELFRSVIPDG